MPIYTTIFDEEMRGITEAKKHLFLSVLLELLGIGNPFPQRPYLIQVFHKFVR